MSLLFFATLLDVGKVFQQGQKQLWEKKENPNLFIWTLYVSNSFKSPIWQKHGNLIKCFNVIINPFYIQLDWFSLASLISTKYMNIQMKRISWVGSFQAATLLFSQKSTKCKFTQSYKIISWRFDWNWTGLQ